MLGPQTLIEIILLWSVSNTCNLLVEDAICRRPGTPAAAGAAYGYFLSEVEPIDPEFIIVYSYILAGSDPEYILRIRSCRKCAK